MKISKAVKAGDMLVKRGDKYIRASARDKRERLVGVYQVGFRQVILPTDDGPMREVNTPTGIVAAGPVRVRRGKEV